PHECQQVNHQHPMTFYFDGEPVRALAGDTVASALYASGRRVFSRSFKYHRPRGLLCCSGDCPNCIMEIDGRPNVRACRTSMHENLQAVSQHAWPSLDHDVLRVVESFDRFLPIGFYYKTLYKRRLLWKIAEPVIRRMAGLGRVRGGTPTHWPYEHRYEYTDVMVVGAGPAGMEAARHASAAGASVLLVESEQLGGHLRFETRPYIYEGAERPGYAVGRTIEQGLLANSNIRIFTGATALGSYEGGLVPILQGETLIHVRTRALVVATGCHQYPPVFRNNDLPGVMLSRAALRLIHLFAVRPGKRAVMMTANEEGYSAALESLRAGIDIAEVLDVRVEPCATRVASELRAAGVRITPGSAIREALGSRTVSGVRVGLVNSEMQPVAGSERIVTCDLVLLSTGWQGNAALLLQAGCQLELHRDIGHPVPTHLPPGVFAAGEVLGLCSLPEILQSGRIVGQAAAKSVEDANLDSSIWWNEIQQLCSQAGARSKDVTIPVAGQRKNFICLCEDVVENDLRQGVQEGFDEIETLKRYSTASMGPCQGRMCSRNSAEVCRLATRRDFGAVGMTTARPPICPVPLGALAGPEFHPVKRTSMHYKHVASADTIMDMGVWKRPFVYTTVSDEQDAVRNHAGLIDVSTLGKLVIKGKDAPLLLDKVYTHWFSRLEPGRMRYGVICDDAGSILDDGTVARIAADHYYITTSTGNVDFVEQWMKWWAVGTGWCVHVLNVTAGMAAVNVAGPKARDILARITDLDMSVFPYMACREATVAGVPALLLRVGFVGETGWEIHFPAEYGEYLWDLLLETGKDLRLRPFGVETQRLLRLEKKHIIVGQDTDALSNPYDSDMKWVVRLDKSDFIGRHALANLQSKPGPNRLIGFECIARACLLDGNAVVIAGKLAGRITSVRFSPQLKKYIGMAWVPTEYSTPGTAIGLHADGIVHPAVISDKPFYDPEGIRLK
ncbi:MAG: (2Fe-2S)-binding protein, partial [Acidobacteria bacterium]|nr:(2Fe-2S)-binding protein [Acidobacteriota bacterium]